MPCKCPRFNEVVCLSAFVAGAGVLGAAVAKEIAGRGEYTRQYIDHPAGQVLTVSPLDLGLTYEDVGEKPPVR